MDPRNLTIVREIARGDVSVEELKAQQEDDNPLFIAIRREGVKRELPLITATLKAFSEGKVKIMDGKVVDVEGKPINGYDLTDEINAQVKGVR